MRRTNLLVPRVGLSCMYQNFQNDDAEVPEEQKTKQKGREEEKPEDKRPGEKIFRYLGCLSYQVNCLVYESMVC